MKFVVMVAYEDSAWSNATEAEREEYFDAHHAFERAITQRGRLVAGEALMGAETATTLRHQGDQVVTTQGPFAETAEQIGGFYLVDLPDLATMTEVAALLPRSYAVEIRGVIEIEGFESTTRESDLPAATTAGSST